MRHKSIKLLSLILVISACMFCLTACNGKNDEPLPISGEEQEFPTHEHTYTETVINPTCTEQGYTLHKCSCGDEYNDNYVSALGHNYGTPTYTWDGQNCTAKRVCLNDCGHFETETAKGEYVKDTDATCFTPEKGHYIANFTCKAYYSQTTAKNSVENGSASNHNYGTPTYTWDGQNCTAKMVCLNDSSHIETETVTGVYVKDTDATSLTCEKGHYKATFTNPAFAEQRLANPDVSHNIVNHICSVCGYDDRVETALTFEKISEKNEYMVTGITDSSIKFVYIPETYNGLPVTAINDRAFYGNTLIEKIVVPKSVQSIGDAAFGGCSGLTSITVPFVGAKAGVTSRDTYQYPLGYIFGTSSYTGGRPTWQYYHGSSPSYTTNVCYYIPTALKEVTVTGGNVLYGAFYGCDYLTSIIIENDAQSIDDLAFKNCSSLTSITIGSGVQSIGKEIFYDCTSLTNITVAEDNKNYKSIDGNLYSKDGKTLIQYAVGKSNSSFIVPDSVQSIGNYAFRKCSSLTSIEIPDSVQSIEMFAFSYGSIENATIPALACKYIANSKLKTVVITSGTSIEDSAFYSCSLLESVTIGNSVQSIGSYAFYNCSSLESIEIPDSVKSIGKQAFYNCSSLESVTIGNGVQSIGNSAFTGCISLTSITIGNSVEDIGGYAFYYCSSLTSITFNGSMAQWQEISKGSSWNELVPATVVHCSNGNVAIS